MGDHMEYAKGTSLHFSQPWGLTCRGKALCPDGKVRAFRGNSADTYFSIPARVSARGTTVSGYVTVESVQGFSTVTEDDPAVVKFVPYKYRTNWKLVCSDKCVA
jgi:hypothetical protein